MGRWYIPSQDKELSKWHRAVIAKATAAGAVQQNEPERVRQTINGIDILPLTDGGASPPATQRVTARTISHDGSAATAEYTYGASPLADQKSDLHVQADAKAEALIQAGFAYEIPGSGNSHTYAIDDRTQNHMLAIQTDLSNGGSGPVDGVWPDVTDTDRTFTNAEWEAFARAARTYKEAILRNLRLLHRDIDAAANQGAINQIDIEDGTGNNNPTSGVNASGWPS